MKTLLLTALLMASAPAASVVLLPKEVSSSREALARFDEASKVRLVNLWATWCVPCVAEMEDLETLQRDLGPRGLGIIGISMDDMLPGDRGETREKVRRFLEQKGITYENVYDTGKADAIAEELHIEGAIPVTLVFDRNGKELMRVEGVIDLQEIESRILGFLDSRK